MATKDDDRLIAYVQEQLGDPQQFVDKIRELYASPHATVSTSSRSRMAESSSGTRFRCASTAAVGACGASAT